MVEYIGIDIGGTNIRIGAIDEQENIIFIYKESTLKNVTTAEDLCNKIKSLIKNIPDYQNAKAIGLGIAASVDERTGEMITVTKNINFLKEIPLVQKLQQEFNKPIYIENDARVEALAEAIKGKGKDKRIVCYITISTGLGGGVVVEKNIYHGSNNLGAYFARMILDGKNTSHSLISGTALLEQAKEKINENIKNTLEVFELQEKGNEIAGEIINDFKRNLKVLLLNISSTINPDIIILGGGVLKSKEKFLADVINDFKLEAHPLAQNTIIDTAVFEEPGVIGAALLAKRKLNLN